MSTPSFGVRRSLVSLLFAAAALASFTPLAQAADPSPSTQCQTVTDQSTPFVPWLDLNHYVLSPGGDFEGSLAGWGLPRGAGPVAGNESFYVGSSSDSRSLTLPNGAATTSAPICVGLDYPTLRFFLRNSGSPSGQLKVEVLGATPLGLLRVLQSTTVDAGPEWSPSPPVLLVSNLSALLTRSGTTPVAVRFTPNAGSWQIDDLYVDPYRRG